MLSTLILTLALAAFGEEPPAPPVEGSKAPLSIDPLAGETYRPNTPAPSSTTDTKPRLPKPPQPIQFDLAVQLVEPGQKPRIVDLERTVFRSGDRIQLKLASPTAGYAAVAQIGSDGTASLLFPAPELGMKNPRIEPGATVILPSRNGTFEFDHQAGSETLVFILTAEAQPIEELVSDFDRARLEAWTARHRPKEGSKNLRTVKTDAGVSYSQSDGAAIVEVMTLRHE